MSTTGEITLDGVLAYTPVGCGSPVLSGPTAPELGEVGCYGLFSSDGPVENAGTTSITGDVGCNVGLTTGFDSLTVTGNIHPKPDASTATAAQDLQNAYNDLNGLAHDIELLYPAQFGGNLVLTPHTYLLDAATSLTDTLYLNAQGVDNAVFVIQIEGALSTSSFSNVVLINGTQAKNVYWLVNGAVDINDNSIFNGTIVSQGAIDLFTGVQLNGRALTGVGALATNAIDGNAVINPNCETKVGESTSVDDRASSATVSIYPNPIGNAMTVTLEGVTETNEVELLLYNALGEEIMNRNITSGSTTIGTSHLTSGIYFYNLVGNNQVIKSGKLIAQQ
jgi:hypothetical protein